MSDNKKHVHVHVHPHTHEHPHTHDVNDHTQENEQLVLLDYMLHHNEQHLDEFVEMMDTLRKQGRDDVADLVAQAVDLLGDADILLEDAVELLKGEA